MRLWVWSLGLELWCRWQMWLRSHIAVAGSYNSDSIPSLGTSLCRGCAIKSKKKKKMKTFPPCNFSFSFNIITFHKKENYNLEFLFYIFSTNLDKSQLITNTCYLEILYRIHKNVLTAEGDANSHMAFQIWLAKGKHTHTHTHTHTRTHTPVSTGTSCRNSFFTEVKHIK